MFGPDGKNVSKMTWEKFCDFQRWSEFPERKNDPPMTTDFAFWINGKKFFCTGEDFGNIIADENWRRLAYNVNFLALLEMPIFEGKSFRECIEEILFED